MKKVNNTDKIESFKKIYYRDIIGHLIVLILLSVIYIYGFKMNYMDSVKTIGVLSLVPLITMITYKILKNKDKDEFNKIKIYTFISSFSLWFVSSTYVNYIGRDKTMSFQRIIVLIIFSLIFSTIVTSIYVYTRTNWNIKVKK
ncbi:hypothetical protein KQI42_00465 [Tissierella sp. MSJ-40]|uniref:Uncharacterized protein n=1 Tax=Tissierella simiarum TaxID=2841534 RepID=A0ABS6E0N2_9FIRM|nr:hypothetical protein [Tissierella simiarum]MBU5436455.1 hypothetical protein [Tissierella simiarum]